MKKEMKKSHAHSAVEKMKPSKLTDEQKMAVMHKAHLIMQKT